MPRSWPEKPSALADGAFTIRLSEGVWCVRAVRLRSPCTHRPGRGSFARSPARLIDVTAAIRLRFRTESGARLRLSGKFADHRLIISSITVDRRPVDDRRRTNGLLHHLEISRAGIRDELSRAAREREPPAPQGSCF